MKKIILIITLFSATQTFGQNSKVQEALNLFNVDSLTNFVKQLTGLKGINIKDTIKTRLSGSTGNELTFQFAKEKFSSWHLNVDSQQFSVSGKNLFAIKKGYKSNKYILLGAHYDAVSSSNPAFHYPGADDNASGTAAVIEAARVISKINCPYTIMLALWDEEEQGFLGSKAFSPPDNVRDFMGYINLDMIAWDGNNDSSFEIHSRDISYSNQLSQRAISVLNLYNIGLKPTIINPGSNATDHISFWNFNLTAIGINEEYRDDFNPNWHKSSDSLNKFNVAYFSKMAQLALATLVDVASDTINIVGVNEISNSATFKIYPNPVEDILYLNFNTSKIKYNSLVITDVTGKQVSSFIDISNLSFLNLSSLNQGTYFLTLFSTNKTSETLKIIKL